MQNTKGLTWEPASKIVPDPALPPSLRQLSTTVTLCGSQGRCLARCTLGNTSALLSLDAAGNPDSLPDPAGAGTSSTEDINRGGGRSNGTMDTVDDEVSDGDTSGGRASWATVEVILLDNNTILGDVGKSNVLEGNCASDSPSVPRIFLL